MISKEKETEKKEGRMKMEEGSEAFEREKTFERSKMEKKLNL